MRLFLNYIKQFLRVFYWPIYYLSGFFSRDEKIWVFGSLFGRRFADNPKYLFLDIILNEKDSDIKPIWITRDKKVFDYLKKQGLPSCYLYSLKGIYYSLRGKIWIYDHSSHDISFWLSNGAIKVNLWHGVPLKKISWDSNPKHFQGIMKFLGKLIFPWAWEKPNYIISPADITDSIFKSAFRIEKGIFIKVGYPRVKTLLYPDRFNLENKLKFLNRKVILYAPTFRDNSSEDLLMKVLDFEKLDDFLSQNNSVMLIKPHPFSRLSNFLKSKSFTNIYTIGAYEDIYQYLPFVHILITDYSSIYYDFLYTNRPIIFFPYDLEIYTKMDRELYFNYEEYTPGPKVYNTEELINELKKAFYNDIYDSIRKQFFQKVGLSYNFNVKEEILKSLIENEKKIYSFDVCVE